MSSSAGKKRLRSAVVANNTVPRNRAPVVSTGEPTMSDIVGGMASGHHFLRIQSYSSTVKGRPTGEYIRSHHFTVGGHHWCIDYFPNGTDKAYADHVSLRLILHQSINNPAVKSQHLFCLAGEAGTEAEQAELLSLEKVRSYTPGSLSACAEQFIKRTDLEASEHLRSDSFTIRCDIAVVQDFRAVYTTGLVSVPPCDLGRHLGELLETEKDANVVFEVGSETVSAHRCVLAARSPVFAAELRGPMKEGDVATGGVVRIQDMEAEAFKALIRFAYTGSLPETSDEEDESVTCQHLIGPADRYNMERLKLICEQKLCRYIDVDSVMIILALAEQHQCQGLKKACFNFLSTPANLRAVMATDDFKYMITTCPSIMYDLMPMSYCI
ncbi:hypothetical protein ZWY2020_023289 [Hordeum vulgare]|nr:hypothetical protein ZWY2020_023289 [Hordeum vulgare]